MLAHLAKLSSTCAALRKSKEKTAIVAAIGSAIARNPLKAMTAAMTVAGTKDEHKKNMAGFREAAGQVVPSPPGVGHG